MLLHLLLVIRRVETSGSDHPKANESREQIRFEKLKYLDMKHLGRKVSSESWRRWGWKGKNKSYQR